MAYYGYITGCPCEYCDKERAREVADKAAAEQVAEATPVAAPTSRLLTREMLLKGSPCYEYRNRFTERYGENGVEVTVEKALSEADDWDWEWAGAILLSRNAKAEFSRRSREADNKYDRTMQPYWDLLNAAKDEYYQVRDAAGREAYEKGLGYDARYAYMDEKSKPILAAQNAAVNAANEIAAKQRSTVWITAFAELFVTDGPAYEEEHKNDDPVYDPDIEESDEYEDDYYDENEDY